MSNVTKYPAILKLTLAELGQLQDEMRNKSIPSDNCWEPGHILLSTMYNDQKTVSKYLMGRFTKGEAKEIYDLMLTTGECDDCSSPFRWVAEQLANQF